MVAAVVLWVAGRAFTKLGDRCARHARRRIDTGWGGRLWLS